jgi:hypothetical protein
VKATSLRVGRKPKVEEREPTLSQHHASALVLAISRRRFASPEGLSLEVGEQKAAASPEGLSSHIAPLVTARGRRGPETWGFLQLLYKSGRREKREEGRRRYVEEKDRGETISGGGIEGMR